MRTIFSNLTFVSVLLASSAHAQMDATTALLVRRPTAAPSSFDARREPKKSRAKIVITPEPVRVAPVLTPVAPHAIDLEARQPASEREADDVHEETLGVRFSAGYLNLDGVSSFAPRNYSGDGAIVGVGMTLWATPTYGVRADYQSSLAASVRDAKARYGLDHQEIDAAAVYRHPRGASSWDLGVGYHQVTNALPRGDANPYGTRSRGLDLSVGLDVRGNAAYAHHAELHVQPVLAHDEIGVLDGTGSGRANTSYGASAVVGGRYEPSREREYFWRLQYTFEQNVFSGGRTVTGGQARLSLGISWGS